jgi:hypothetical protein
MRFLAILLLGGVVTSSGRAQAPTVPYDGTEVFCHLLHQEGRLHPLRDLLAIDPQQSLLIVFGDLGGLLTNEKLLPGGLEQYWRRGGNILLAGDVLEAPERAERRVLGLWQLRFAEWVRTPAAGYRGHASCPFIGMDRLARTHPLFAGMRQGLATNGPRSLRVSADSTLQVLARLPTSGAAGVVARGAEPVYAVASPEAAPRQGRVLVIAGHGIFMNCMLVQRDCDNLLFASNCIRWLRESPTGTPRPLALFIVDGKVIDRFDVSLAPPLPPIPLPGAALLDQLLADLEDEDFFRRWLASVPGLIGRAIHGLVITATILLLLYGCKKLLTGRYHLETTEPLSVGLSVRGWAQRHEEMLARNSFAEPARSLAQAWFRERGIPDVMVGSFWQRRRLRRQVREAWKLAQPDSTARVSRRRFLALAQSLATLTAAFEAGQLRFRESVDRSL